MLRLILAILIGKLIFFLTRFLKKGGGSAAPGHFVLKICPELVTRLSSQIPTNIVITGTNGKTTTARILNHLVKSQKIKVLRNATGSNLERGVASTLINKVNFLGQIKDIDLGIWELDEAAFNKIVFQIKPQIIVFLNAFRDQLDRYGEVDTVVKRWQDSLERVDFDPLVIINGSDTNTSKLNSSTLRTKIFGIKDILGSGETQFKILPRLKFDITAQNLKTNRLEGISFQVTVSKVSININLPIPGVYHVFDFLAAFAVYYNLNLPTEDINNLIKDYSPAFGRVEHLSVGGRDCYIFLIKNPEGTSLVFETITPEIKDGDRLLIALNDNFADGKDVSWIWDAKFSIISKASESVKSVEIICSGTRAYDLAIRLKYAGFNTSQILIEQDLKVAFEKATKNLDGKLFILPTYTGLLGLQKILAQKGHKRHYWKEEE